jgi:two-component system, OmpR family, sensor kinase
LTSIRRDLLLWVTGTLVLGVAAAAVATYQVARQQIDEIFDSELHQIAQAVHLREDWMDAGNVRIAREGVSFAVRAYDEGGKVFFESGLPALPVDVPKTLDPGFSSAQTPEGPWRVYTHVSPEGLVQVAQPEAIRDALARELLLRMAVPQLVFIPVLAGLIIWVLRRMLRPLYETSARVRERDASRLDPLPTADVPEELLPLVGQINELLARLASSLENERRFFADAAHELRSPVTALSLQVQIAERARTDAARAAALAELRKGTARAGRLVQQLLDLARLEPGVASEPAGPVDLAELVREVIGEFAVRADAQGVDLGAEVPPSREVTGVAHELRSLVANLVDNALRYSPAGGAVTVSLRDAGDEVELSVEDAGPGIPPEHRERVLRRFQRIPGDATLGSGLGLPIAKAIAERHRGSLQLREARPGRQPPGLSVQVRLPLAA